MKFKTRTLLTGLVAACAAMAVAASPALSESNEEAQKACEDKASKHEPPLSSVDWEVFMADCLADATATTSKEE